MGSSRPKALLLAFACLVALPDAALATNCRTWERLGPDQKAQQIDRMIQQAVRSSRGRQYTSVSRGAVERCLYGQARNIEYEFDDICASGRAGMNSLRVVFKDYVWSCIQ